MRLRPVAPPVGITVEAGHIGDEDTEAQLALHTDAGLPAGDYSVTIRGTGFMDQIEIVTEATVQVCVH